MGKACFGVGSRISGAQKLNLPACPGQQNCTIPVSPVDSRQPCANWHNTPEDSYSPKCGDIPEPICRDDSGRRDMREVHDAIKPPKSNPLFSNQSHQVVGLVPAHLKAVPDCPMSCRYCMADAAIACSGSILRNALLKRRTNTHRSSCCLETKLQASFP